MFNRFTITIGIGALALWLAVIALTVFNAVTDDDHDRIAALEANQRALTAQLATEIAIVNDLRRALDLLADDFAAEQELSDANWASTVEAELELAEALCELLPSAAACRWLE